MTEKHLTRNGRKSRRLRREERYFFLLVGTLAAIVWSISTYLTTQGAL